jgi:CxC2 like cysteine cluster associated with KDZ transposases
MRHPFHRIECWTGSWFLPSSLYHQGYILHVGHSGEPCPSTTMSSDWNDEDIITTGLLDEDEPPEEAVDVAPQSEVNRLLIVDSTGIYHHRVRWCTCPGYPARHIQLLRSGLFASSFTHPATAFTTNVLDVFYIDAMECKTAALSFFAKLQRLTNNAFPDKVPVSSNPLM